MNNRPIGSWSAMVALLLLCAPALQAQDSTSSSPPSSAEDNVVVPPRGGEGHIRIETTPEKAAAYMDGVELGLTPVDTTFQSGRFTLTLLLNGEELVHERVNIWPGRDTLITKKLLMPYGSVVIHPDPLRWNYRVQVDGEDVGETRGGVLTINKLDAGTRVIRLTYGRHSKEFTIDILPEKSVDLNADFKKR